MQNTQDLQTNGIKLRKETKICKQEKLMNIEIGEKHDNECDVKLHFRISYHIPCNIPIFGVLTFMNP
jgi:hypothetical protein